MQKVEQLPAGAAEDETRSFTARRRFPRRAPWAAALSMSLTCAIAVGCAPGGEQTSTIEPATATSQAPERYPIQVFSDFNFTQHVGDVAAYDIICVYRKNRDHPSIQPANVRAYVVESTDPPGINGFVDPAHPGIVSGSSPECDTPPYPGPLPETNPSVRASTRA